MTTEQVLAFRLARSGLTERTARGLAEAAACPASDFARDGALLALAARAVDVTAEAYRHAVEAGDLVVAHAPRGAIHALAPGDVARAGPALIARDDAELGPQLGRQVARLCAEAGITPTAALAEVAAATAGALAGGRRLGKDELHEELRARVRPELLPWCRGCASHHVAPMLWRYATVEAGARLDAERRYLVDDRQAGGTPRSGPQAVPADASDAVRWFLGFYGPARPADFAEWAGVAPAHARRLWAATRGGLVAIGSGRDTAWLVAGDEAELASPPQARGVHLLPPGDPYLRKPNRALVAPDPALRRRLFRPVGSPGAVLHDGRLAGLWRMRLEGRSAQITVQPLGRSARREIGDEAERVARLRGAAGVALVIE